MARHNLCEGLETKHLPRADYRQIFSACCYSSNYITVLIWGFLRNNTIINAFHEMHEQKCSKKEKCTCNCQLCMQWKPCFQSIRWRCCCCCWLRLGSLRCWTEHSSCPTRGAPSRGHTSWPNTWTTSWRRSETLTWVTLCLCVLSVCDDKWDVFVYRCFPVDALPSFSISWLHLVLIIHFSNLIYLLPGDGV